MEYYACRVVMIRQCHRIGIGFIFKSISLPSLNKYLRSKGDHYTGQIGEGDLVILKILIYQKYVDADQTAAGEAV